MYSNMPIICVLPEEPKNRYNDKWHISMYCNAQSTTKDDTPPRMDESHSSSTKNLHVDHNISEGSLSTLCDHITSNKEYEDSQALEPEKISTQERNRLSAMRTRQRKKESIKKMQEEIKDLHRQNLMLIEENHKLKGNMMRWNSLFNVHRKVCQFKDEMVLPKDNVAPK
jgi:hypothetical protein